MIRSMLCAIALLSAALPARAGDPSALSAASELSAEGSARIASGAFTLAAGSAEFLITGVHAAGDGLSVVLKGVAQAGEVVLFLPRALVGGLSLAAGQTVVVVGEGAGWLITKGTQVLAFVPNAAGKRLLKSQRFNPQ